MIASLTSSNQATSSYPADIAIAQIGLSMSRKLRGGYTGQYFRFRNESGEFDYPENQVTEDSYLVRIYDQTSGNHAEQLDQDKQPQVKLDDNSVPYAQFELGKYLDAPNVASTIGKYFVITAIGEGDFSRPMVGITGENDSVTIEPGNPTRFRFNNNTAMSENSADKINRYESGYSEAQNGNYALNIQSDGGGSGNSLGEDGEVEFDTFSVGRAKDRGFAGKFKEVLVFVGAKKNALAKIWEGLCLSY